MACVRLALGGIYRPVRPRAGSMVTLNSTLTGTRSVRRIGPRPGDLGAAGQRREDMRRCSADCDPLTRSPAFSASARESSAVRAPRMSSGGPWRVASGEMVWPERASTPSRCAVISISPSSVRTWIRAGCFCHEPHLTPHAAGKQVPAPTAPHSKLGPACSTKRTSSAPGHIFVFKHKAVAGEMDCAATWCPALVPRSTRKMIRGK